MPDRSEAPPEGQQYELAEFLSQKVGEIESKLMQMVTGLASQHLHSNFGHKPLILGSIST